MPTKLPSYRKRKGYSQALVTLTDAVTKRRRDYWLGEYGTPESREAYHRIIAKWEATKRRLPTAEPNGTRPKCCAGPTITELVRDYWRWAEEYYRPNHSQSLICALRLIRHYYGQTPAAEFGPKKLRLLREEMIRGDEKADPPRRPWSRNFINAEVQRIRHMFKWAVAHEMVTSEVHHALCTLEPLKRGRTTAREGKKVGPVPQAILDATIPLLSQPLRALVELQLLTGARPGELLELRKCDVEIDKATGVWTYRPEKHKNAYRDRDRIIYFGPRAQEILASFMIERSPTTYLFSPTDAVAENRARRHAERTTPLSCGNRPGSTRRKNPEKSPGEFYKAKSYRMAIQYACKKAFPPPPPFDQQEREGLYTVSTEGRVCSHFNGRDRFLACSPDSKGYLQFAMSLSGGRRVRMKVHQAVALTFLGPRPPGAQINHISGDKRNNSVTNLEYVSCRQNIRHAWKMGLRRPEQVQGERHGRSKLTDEKVRHIRLVGSKATIHDLANRFGVTPQCIDQVLKHKTWRHVA